MAIDLATVTAKGKVTVPKAIRDVLGVRQGDRLSWEIDNGAARVKVVSPLDLDYMQGLDANLQDWASTADDEAFAKM